MDPQAVEVAQLSLYLKLLEEETTSSARTHQIEFRETLLPSLSRNVVCGNSLIEPEDINRTLTTEEQELKLKPFSIKSFFPKVFENGGFDAIIGNPPYVGNDMLPDEDKYLYQAKYSTGKKFDLYLCFIESGLSLLNESGMLGYILPNTFLTGTSYFPLRKKLLNHVAIEQLVDLPQGVFEDVVVDNVLLFLKNRIKTNQTTKVNLLYEKCDKTRVLKKSWDDEYSIKQSDMSRGELLKISLSLTPKFRSLFDKMEKTGSVLGDYFQVCDGLITDRTAADAEKSKYTSFEPRKGWDKLLRGKDISRYRVSWRGEYVKYGDHLWRKRDESFFKSDKILLHSIRNKSLARRLVGSIDYEKYYNTDNLINVISGENKKYSLEFMVGLLNSKLINTWYKTYYPNVNINPNELRSVPLPITDEKIITQVAELAKTMKECANKMDLSNTESEKEYFKTKFESTDNKIDELIYSIFELSKADIAFVEGNFKE